MAKLSYDYKSFLAKYRTTEGETTEKEYVTISQAEEIFLQRSAKKCGNKFAKFYITAKIHKTPWATRPVVSTCGTLMAGLSKWTDYWLQQLTPNIPTYLRDSSQLLEQLKKLGPLSPGARLFTADAVSMYTNIETSHGLRIINEWMTNYQDELPDDFPSAAMKNALRMVLTNNIFEFGDSFLNNSAAVRWVHQWHVYMQLFTMHTTNGQSSCYKNTTIILSR